jgi:hypothetical protein
MTEKDTPRLQNSSSADHWLRDSGMHYRELAEWLRDIARKCLLPNPQRELLVLAKRYDLRAEQFQLRTRRGVA